MSEIDFILNFQIGNDKRSSNKGTIELTNKTINNYQQDFKMMSQKNNTYLETKS